MNWLKKMIERIKLEIRYRKKLKELRKRDPFIYK
jgi:hypothetical protein